MGFKCGIIGLPNVGKSTLFNALIESNRVETANYPFTTIEPNVGRTEVPDERLKILSNIIDSEKTTPTFIDFIDIAGLVKGASIGEGLGNKFLAHIREVDAIIHVVRCFKDENIVHLNPNINPLKDIEIITTELILSDLEMLKNISNKFKQKFKSGDNDIGQKIETISRIIEKINNSEKISNINLSIEQNEFIKNLNLIITKPMLYVCNVDEKSIITGNAFSKEVDQIAKKECNKSVVISALMESQIIEHINKKEKLEILNNINLNKSNLKKIISASYALLNLMTFFTCNSKESKAWTINRNTKALEAAGKVHKDFKKGFIRVETIAYIDYINHGGEVGCREAGKLRQEGKEYFVKDGDILKFLFNV